MRRLDQIPAIPPTLLKAHDRGELVFFCGSGISMGAGLPDFANLVKDAFAHLKTDMNSAERRAMKRHDYDRVLHLLERRVDATPFRQAVRACLQPTKQTIEPHAALLKLARTPAGRLRLVTTNFDGLFDRAHKRLSDDAQPLPAEDAPALGVPNQDHWNSLVFLHGRLSDHRYPDDRNLVLTSGDFGRAYLTERWASRFVTSLIRDYVVVFVGYSASDPVMRYVLDAFAADQPSDPRLYAFAGYKSTKHRPKVEADWQQKGVACIPYLARGGNHRRLSIALSDWAEKVENGLQSRVQTVVTNIQALPSTIPEDQRQYVLWALEAPNAKAARRLTDDHPPRPVAPIEWIDEFERHGLLSSSATTTSGQCPLVSKGGSTTNPTRLSAVAEEFAAWLASFAHSSPTDSARLLQWVLRQGGALHPRLRQLFTAAIDNEPEAPHTSAWRLILEPSVNAALQPFPDHRECRAVTARLTGGAMPHALEESIARLIEPFVEFEPLLGRYTVNDPPGQGERPSDYFRSRITFLADEYEVAELLGTLTSLRDVGVAEALWPIVQARSIKALRLLELTDPLAGYHQDCGPNELNVGVSGRTYGGWKNLAFLWWTFYRRLDRAKHPAALAMYLSWLEAPFVLARRMALSAAMRSESLTRAQRKLALTTHAEEWFWNSDVESALLECLRAIGGTLSKRQLARITNLAMSGPAASSSQV